MTDHAIFAPSAMARNLECPPSATIAVWLNEHPDEDAFTAGEAIWAALQADGHVRLQEGTER